MPDGEAREDGGKLDANKPAFPRGREAAGGPPGAFYGHDAPTRPQSPPTAPRGAEATLPKHPLSGHGHPAISDASIDVISSSRSSFLSPGSASPLPPLASACSITLTSHKQPQVR
ncbi:hypothetical protein E2C01_084268 [Portunus trituberculatus]|uniref:Uncharacterized protein n=1 Tax=Portunus trituberculatus TaxID=210409 RepID=A0A5B7J702_PORTR|nr:hypothetical protein [Portunus trituberculatus]